MEPSKKVRKSVTEGTPPEAAQRRFSLIFYRKTAALTAPDVGANRREKRQLRGPAYNAMNRGPGLHVKVNGEFAAMALATTPLIPTDETLHGRAVAGDAAALDELLQRYRGVAYRVAHRLLGHDADALDAVQEAFIKVLTHLPSFEGRSSFKTWLLRVVSNAALDLRRQRRRRDMVSVDAFGAQQREDLEPRTSGEASHRLERDDLHQALHRALTQLSPAHRQTFVLHAEAELTYREVAEILGISIGTVMSRLYYARQRLRELLNGWMMT
jgi:RNA polymerase sigma-70 factor (ECF subfamily)